MEDLEKKLEEAGKTYYHYGDRKGNRRGKVECKNTYRIQLTSIHLFAGQIAYMYNPFTLQDGSYFENEAGDKISFKRMQEMHNRHFLDNTCWHGVDLELPKMSEKLGIPLEWMRNAIEAKLVKRTYFQVSKKKRLKVQKHLITFA